MQVTRRFWALALLGGLLAALAVLYADPLLLAGAVGVAARLLAAQYAFVRALVRTDRDLAVTQTVADGVVSTDQPTTSTVALRLDDPAVLRLAATAEPPVTAATTDRAARTATVAPGDRTARTTYDLQPTVAGEFAFDPPTVRATDRPGLFAETLSRGTAPTLTVQARRPRNVHLGRGGDRVAGAFGEHTTGRTGGGIEPAEIREYVPGDAAQHIDWKATARMGEPHVREFQAETDRRTVLLLDARGSLALGPDGETAFDYLREVALTVAGTARDLDDPLGLYAVGDAGITAEFAPDATTAHYAALQGRLRNLEPTTGDGSGDGGGVAAATPAGRDGRRPATRRAAADPAAARAAADLLAGDGSAFAATLAPYLRAADAYVARIAGDPLFGTARSRVRRLPGRQWTVLLTDDADRVETRETVKLLRRGDDRVLVVLAPRVLFEPGGLADPEDAYARYREFESFRRDLDDLDRVTALEVGPGDRLATLLADRRRAGRQGGVGA